MSTPLARALERLAQLHPKRIDLSLGRCYRLLDRLGRPQERLPPVVHVAGTNGKGSVVAFLRAFLEADGQRVHVYTSPHLVRFAERIRLAGCLIKDDHLVEVLDACEQANGDDPITFFEVTTAAAMLAFAETPADVLLLEVGLGGRLDATNVVESPLASAVTRISFDHMQYLGSRISEIAAEKAGIARYGVPMVVAPQKDTVAVKTIVAKAEEAGAPLDVHGRDWWIESHGGGLEVRDRYASTWYPPPGLIGRHQLDNAATAIRVAEKLGRLAPRHEAIERGLAAVEWPARLMRLSRGPLVSSLPAGGCELWLDGGHNDSAGVALADWLREKKAGPVHLVVGMLESKEPKDFLTPLAAVADRLTAIEIPEEHASLAPAELASAGRACGFTEVVEASYDQLREVLPASPAGLVLICGSLYLAGRVLREHG